MTLRLIEQRRPSWSTFTTQFDKGVTAQEAITAATMRNLVVKSPLMTQDPSSGEIITVENKFMVYAPETGKFFGTCGNDYDFLQPSELATILDATLTSRFPVVAAGETPDGGGAVFVLDMGDRPVAKEMVHQYFTIAESYTPGVALKWAFTPLRIQCQNVLMTAFAKATTLITARHDRNFRTSVTDGANFVLSAERQAEKTMALFDRMSRQQISPEELAGLWAAAYPHRNPAKISQLERSLGDVTSEFANTKLTKLRDADKYWNGRADILRQAAQVAFESFDTDNPRIRGTVWAAYNALVEVQDFHNFSPAAATADQVSSLVGPRADVKLTALNYAAGLVR